jgi:glycosyltransferase involved in cell wall biosynthesis
MRIAIVLGAFFPVPPVMGGAVEKAWLALAEEFAARGHQVTMVSRRFDSFPNGETVRGVQHRRVPGFSAPRSLFWLKFLDLTYSFRASAALPEADVLITNTFWLPLFVRNRGRGFLYVHVARFPKGQLRFYKRAAQLQAPSEAIAREIRRQAPGLADRVRVIPYPVPTVAKDRLRPMSQRPKRFLYVGRIHPEKGIHLLVQCFAERARTDFAEWELMITGPANTEGGGAGGEYLERLRGLGAPAGDRVIFSGPIFDQTRLSEAMQNARIFVYPSLAETGESFGLAPLEAMANGCAGVVSALECFEEFVHDGSTGYTFDHRAHDPVKALADRLKAAIADETKLAGIAQAGYEKSQEYSSPRVADQFLKDFESILERTS